MVLPSRSKANHCGYHNQYWSGVWDCGGYCCRADNNGSRRLPAIQVSILGAGGHVVTPPPPSLLTVPSLRLLRRYRSQMIETADFKFVDLSEKKRSAWQRFKLKVSKLYAQIRPQRSTEKVGLVNLISGPQYDGQTSSSSSNSYNTF